MTENNAKNECFELLNLDEDAPNENFQRYSNREEEDFNPYNYGKQKNSISFGTAVIHTFIAAASPTLMNMPYSFNQVGYIIGFLGSSVTVVFYASCMHTLLTVEYVLCKKLHKPCLTYAEIIYYSFLNGPKRYQWFANSARLLVYIDFLCIWGGGNAINALLASENIKCIYDYIFNADVNLRLVMFYLSLPLVALCWIPNLRLLAICSTIANVVNISCIVIILCVSVTDFPTTANCKAIGDISSIPLFLGVILITVNSTGIIIPLKNEMKEPKKLSSKFGVLNVAFFPVCFLFSFLGLLGYMKYGVNVKENIVLNLADNHLGKIVVGLYAAGIIFTYPLMSYVAFDVVWNNILKGKVENNALYAVKKYGCRTFVAASSIAVAFIVPNIALIVSLTGTIGVSLDSIIFPALTQLLFEETREEGTNVGAGKSKRGKHFWKNIACIILGLVLCVSGLLDSLSAVMHHYF